MLVLFQNIKKMILVQNCLANFSGNWNTAVHPLSQQHKIRTVKIPGVLKIGFGRMCWWKLLSGHTPIFYENVTHLYTNWPDFRPNFDWNYLIVCLFLCLFLKSSQIWGKFWKINPFIYQILTKGHFLLPIFCGITCRVFCTEHSNSWALPTPRENSMTMPHECRWAVGCFFLFED